MRVSHQIALCISLVALAGVGACGKSEKGVESQSGGSRWPLDQPGGGVDPIETATLQLRSCDGDEFAHAFERIYASGRAAVPALLESAADSTPVNWSPPILPGRSLCPTGLTLGDVCLYLLESIRVNELMHSYSPTPSAGEVPHSADFAVEEYRRWWASVQRGDSAPYTSTVKWDKLVPGAREAYLREHGSAPEPTYMPVVRRPESNPAVHELTLVDSIECYVNQTVRIRGVAGDCKGYAWLEAPFGVFAVTDGFRWPGEVLGKTVEVVADIVLVPAYSEPARDEDVQSDRSPGEYVPARYGIRNVKQSRVLP